MNGASAGQVLPGDIVKLSADDLVPADARWGGVEPDHPETYR
ncbi:MAG TPA: hypothetical protein VKB29_02940 [Candidatus Binataceae bacterium]|nr:hypothetical protein [Candidatus Binataceae bacterium]